MAPDTLIAGRPSAADVERTWQWLRAAWGGGAAPPVVALVGLGDGSALDALSRYAPATRLLAVEPNPAMATAIAAHPTAMAWQSAGQFVFLSGPDYAGADQAWRIFPVAFETPALVVHPQLEMGPHVAKAAEVLKQILIGAEANATARRRFAPRYLANSLRNLPAVVTGPSVHRLRHAFTGVPAIVVGAGPSLDGAYDDLRAAQGRALIIATDTSLRPLLANGITPALVVGLDPSDVNARHFFSLPACEDTWLVAESALDPRAAAVFSGRTFWCAASAHHPWPWMEQLGAETARLDVWGSVLTGAFQVASLGGCDPIVTVGADLAFTGGRPYARGTTYEFDWAWSAAFGTTVDETWRAHIGRADVELRPALDQRESPTTAILLAFRDWMLAQGRKGHRRIVNASGAGMLFGDGIEQGRLADVIGGRISFPSFETIGARRSGLRPSAIARAVRDLARAAKERRLDLSPLPEWAEFSGGSLHAIDIAAVLEEAAITLESKRGRAVAPFGIPWDVIGDSGASDLMTRLPELSARAGAALRGEVLATPAPTSSVPDKLVRSLELLRTIADEALRGDDFVSWPDPAHAGRVSAAGVGMWPDTLRWAVTAFEATLGGAWGETTIPPAPAAFAGARVLPRETAAGQSRLHGKSRPFATHACVLLVLEWLRCVSSHERGDEARLTSAIGRVAALEQLLRTWPVPAPTGTEAELVVEATAPRSATVLVLPLGMSEALLARVVTGATREHAAELWEIGEAAAGRLSLRIGVRPRPARGTRDRRQAAVAWPAARTATFTPRPLTHASWPAALVAGQVGADALCVTPFTNRTSLISADGIVEPYQTWPRPLTGALSLGDLGEIAWSNAWGPRSGGVRPYLMYRAAPGADVEIVDLPFRPSAGLWWRNRVYWNCQATPQARGGVGSWAPGQGVALDWPDLTLFPIVALANGLALEPYVAGEHDVVLRRLSPSGWTWMPGADPVSRVLGPLGAVSSIVTIGDWTIYAHPQADLLRFVSSGGDTVLTACYYPLRLASAGNHLVVTTGERELLWFELGTFIERWEKDEGER